MKEVWIEYQQYRKPAKKKVGIVRYLNRGQSTFHHPSIRARLALYPQLTGEFKMLLIKTIKDRRIIAPFSGVFANGSY